MTNGWLRDALFKNAVMESKRRNRACSGSSTAGEGFKAGILSLTSETDPTHHDARFALGQGLMSKGEVQRAYEIFSEMVAQDPDQAMTLAELARVHLELGRGEEARQLYARAVDLEPWNPTLQLNLGRALALLGRMGEAAQRGEIAVALDPDSAEAWDYYANVMRAAGRAEQAREGQRVLDRIRSQGAAGSPHASD